MRKNPVHILLLFIVIVFLIWSAIKPATYFIWMLEVGPSLLAGLGIVFTYNKMRFTTLSYVIIAFLIILTFIGGHYTYDDVPLFDWLQQKFNLKRNNYDRFGHFLKGFMFIVIREILIVKTPLPIGKWVQFIAINLTLALAALYEIAEWVSSKISNRKTKDFVGAQGDPFDAQWDMSLLLLGSIMVLILFTSWHNRMLKKKQKNWS